MKMKKWEICEKWRRNSVGEAADEMLQLCALPTILLDFVPLAYDFICLHYATYNHFLFAG